MKKIIIWALVLAALLSIAALAEETGMAEFDANFRKVCSRICLWGRQTAETAAAAATDIWGDAADWLRGTADTVVKAWNDFRSASGLY